MKKISILVLAVLYIGIANLSAQTEATTTETVAAVEEVKETICPKTGKTCEKTCKNKKMTLAANLKKLVLLVLKVKRDLLTLTNLTIIQVKVLVQNLKNVVKRKLQKMILM